MKRWTRNVGTFGLTLLVFAYQASAVWARAGGGVGGSVGGSSGSSFSSGGSFGGSFSGGGFSFLPFFFFGGSSGGSSLFSLLIWALIFYLIYRAWKSSRYGRSNRTKSGKAQGLGGQLWPKNHPDNLAGSNPVDVNGRQISNSANLERFSKAIAFTRENMQYFAQTFPRWDREFLAGRVRQVFFWFQDAWSRQDLSQASEYLVPALAEKYRADLEGMKARGERNMIKDPVLNPEDLEFIYSSLEEGNERFIVMTYASLIDYTIDAGGRQISGDNQNRLYFTEFWEFYWQEDKWLLANILQEDALQLANIARGES